MDTGYPERFAQEALGHNSKTVHRSYAKKAKVMLPSLNEWAAQPRHSLIPFDAHKSNSLQPHIAIWIVANLPKSRGLRREKISFEEKPSQTPAWRKVMSEVYSTDDFDYLRKLDRHQNDPHQWPCPVPPEIHPQHAPQQ